MLAAKLLYIVACHLIPQLNKKTHGSCWPKIAIKEIIGRKVIAASEWTCFEGFENSPWKKPGRTKQRSVLLLDHFIGHACHFSFNVSLNASWKSCEKILIGLTKEPKIGCSDESMNFFVPSPNNGSTFEKFFKSLKTLVSESIELNASLPGRNYLFYPLC